MSKIKDGLSAIAWEVLADTQKEAEAAILNARGDAKEVLRAAKEEAERVYTTQMGENTARIAAEKKRNKSLIEVETRNALLEAKEALVDAAFEKANVEIAKFVSTAAYHDYLLKLIEEAVNKVGSKKVVLQVNGADKAWLTKKTLRSLSDKLGVELKIGKDNEKFIGGCKIRTLDEKIVYDNTIENRWEKLKPELRLEVARILFAEEAS